VAVVGAGYWGINHVRTFAAEPRARLLWVCDPDAASRERAALIAPGCRTAADYERALDDAAVDAVVLATPAVTHADMACRAVDAGKHVFVEKPLALSVDDAVRVADTAARAGKTLMVGHLMLYHPAVLRLGELLASGELGELLYLYATRVNLGRFRRDENALWSFGPHDLSMFDFLLGNLPETVSARGESYLHEGVEDVVFLTVKYAGRELGHIHLSWLDPHKERRLTVVGSKKMVVFDDVAAEKLHIHDRGYERPPAFTQFGEYLAIRHGDIYIPHLAMAEPLAVECAHFVDCVLSGAAPRTGADHALRVVQVLVAAQRSLDRDGAVERVDPV
jgi:predicted dehydrogenase